MQISHNSIPILMRSLELRHELGVIITKNVSLQFK